MPIALPVFADGDTLSALKLNQLVSAANRLEASIQSPVIGFPQVMSDRSGNRKMLLRHQSANRYIHLYYEFFGGSGDDITLNLIYPVGNSAHPTEIFRDGSPDATSFKQVVDIDGQSIPEGGLYELELVWANGNATEFRCQLMMASSWGAPF